RSKRDWSSDVCSSDLAAPWLYGAVHAGFELLLDLGLAVLTLLWAVRMLVQREVVLARCPVTFLLALLLLLGLWQITPLPAGPLQIGRASCRERVTVAA